jgi:hypothetical protein
MDQEGLRKGRGAREQISIVSESWRIQGSTRKMSNSLIDCTKGFGSMQHLKI